MKEFQAQHDSVNNANYGGFSSFGPKGKTVINWSGSMTNGEGVEPIDVVRAVLDRVAFLQKTTSATEPNAKLLFKLTQAVEEFDGKPPTIGGALNDLIPKG